MTGSFGWSIWVQSVVMQWQEDFWQVVIIQTKVTNTQEVSVSDVIDAAQTQSELILQYQIRQLTRRIPMPTRSHCIDCDEPIPLLRQKKVTGCQRCVACQTDFEKQNLKGV